MTTPKHLTIPLKDDDLYQLICDASNKRFGDIMGANRAKSAWSREILREAALRELATP